ELDVEVRHAEDAGRRLADGGERVGQKLVQRSALVDLPAEFPSHSLELRIGERLEARLEAVDLVDERLKLLQLPRVLGSKDLLDERKHVLDVARIGPAV